MIAIPENQVATGVGNKVYKDKLMHNMKSLHFVYLDADDTIYSGNNTLTLKLYASNEKINEISDIVAPVLLKEITLDKTTPSRLFDIFGAYNHLRADITAITDGKVMTYYATREG